MSDTRTKIGIDFRGDLFYIARVDHNTGRPEIKALARLEREHLGQHQLLDGGHIVISLPDEGAVVRKIQLDAADNDFEAQARFELSQSILEDESEFLFDVLPTSQGYHLGLILRKHTLAQLLNSLLQDQKNAFPEAGYKTRAAALADGYINFCQASGGNLVCLADFLPGSVSLAFVYGHQLIDLAHLPLDRFDTNSESDLRRLAVEFKTAVNYRLSSIFASGITTPLTALFVSGEPVNDRIVAFLKEHFPIEITGPRINTGFFSGQADLSEIPLEKYLVALGLAAN